MREKKKPITVVYHGHETSGVERRNESLEVSSEFEKRLAHYEVTREMEEEVLRQQYNLNQYELVFLTIAGLIYFPIVVLFDVLDYMLDLKAKMMAGPRQIKRVRDLN